MIALTLLAVTRILLVDDDEDNLKIFTIILENQGFSVDAYVDPVTALSEFKPSQYDLIILDYRMPEMNGIELYKKIREKDASTKITILTASHEQVYVNDTKELKKEPSLKVIRKPVAVGKLLEEVIELLNETSSSPANILN
ncbi:MAG TPA: response regulator [Nitrososphaeraceae archaeon]